METVKVIGCEPKPCSVLVVVVTGVRGEPEVQLHETFKFSKSEPRPSGLAQLRSRVHTLIGRQGPDLVVIKPIERQALRQGRTVAYATFQSAEVRGVVAEASHEAGASTQFRDGSTVTRTIGSRKGAEYLRDEGFWESAVVGWVPKAYRPAALMAISALEEAA